MNRCGSAQLVAVMADPENELAAKVLRLQAERENLARM
jgi:hypothetical protein